MITRLGTLKGKMQTIQEDEKKIQSQSWTRIEHLGELYGMQSLVDVKFEEWSRTRLNRLLVDYLVRFGFSDTARLLVERKGLEKLTDIAVFEECYQIERSLESNESLTEALAWCNEHKALMKKEKGNVSCSENLAVFETDSCKPRMLLSFNLDYSSSLSLSRKVNSSKQEFICRNTYLLKQMRILKKSFKQVVYSHIHHQQMQIHIKCVLCIN